MMANTSVTNPPPSAEIIQDAAAETGIPDAFIEKDWYAIQVLSVIATHNYEGYQPVFSGGTCLSKGHGLIQRFSEDIDFKISTPNPVARADKRRYREAMIELINGVAGLEVDGASIQSQDASNTFSFNVQYPQTQDSHTALRPHLKIEMSFRAPRLPTEHKPLRSFISILADSEADTHIACVSPIETGADKFSALLWRVLAKDRSQPEGSAKNEPEMIRHLHDLCALESVISDSNDFLDLIQVSYEADKRRGGLAGEHALPDAAQLAFEALSQDKLYEAEYERFVDSMSYANEEDRINFQQALKALTRIMQGVVKS